MDGLEFNFFIATWGIGLLIVSSMILLAITMRHSFPMSYSVLPIAASGALSLYTLYESTISVTQGKTPTVDPQWVLLVGCTLKSLYWIILQHIQLVRQEGCTVKNTLASMAVGLLVTLSCVLPWYITPYQYVLGCVIILSCGFIYTARLETYRDDALFNRIKHHCDSHYMMSIAILILYLYMYSKYTACSYTMGSILLINMYSTLGVCVHSAITLWKDNTSSKGEEDKNVEDVKIVVCM